MILCDIELCNNLIFLLHKSPSSIVLKSNDHFWCGLAEFLRSNYDAAEIRLEQIQSDEPSYLAGILLQSGLKFPTIHLFFMAILMIKYNHQNYK